MFRESDWIFTFYLSSSLLKYWKIPKLVLSKQYYVPIGICFNYVLYLLILNAFECVYVCVYFYFVAFSSILKKYKNCPYFVAQEFVDFFTIVVHDYTTITVCTPCVFLNLWIFYLYNIIIYNQPPPRIPTIIIYMRFSNLWST